MELRLGGLEDGGEEVVAAVAFFGGEGDEADGVRQLQDLADAGQVGRDLALFELIELIGHDHEGLAGLQEVIGCSPRPKA